MMFLIYVVNAMINAYLIGVFIDQFSEKNAKAVEKQGQLDDSNTSMQHLKVLPESLKDTIRVFFLKSFEMKGLQDEYKKI